MQEIFTKISYKFAQELKHRALYPMPPMNLIRNAGSTDINHYIDNMTLYTRDIIEQCMLKRNSSVLDIGCGAGRVANGLVHYLTIDGSYTGVDSDQRAISWCKKNISVKNSNFEFYSVDIKNDYYHNDDNNQSNQYDLSFLADKKFDCVIALSIFNHLKLGDTKVYLSEISKRLTKNGVAYLTFFTIDDAFFDFRSRTNKHKGLKKSEDGVWYGYKKQSFFAGYEEDFLNQLLDNSNLRIINHSPGSWVQKKKSRIYLDWYLVSSKN